MKGDVNKISIHQDSKERLSILTIQFGGNISMFIPTHHKNLLKSIIIFRNINMMQLKI